MNAKLVKYFVGGVLAFLLCLINAAFATYVLSWVGLSFWHWFQICIIANAVINAALLLYDFRKEA